MLLKYEYTDNTLGSLEKFTSQATHVPCKTFSWKQLCKLAPFPVWNARISRGKFASDAAYGLVSLELNRSIAGLEIMYYEGPGIRFSVHECLTSTCFNKKV